MKFRVERLANGLIRLFDYRCKWDVYYNPNGTFNHGPCNPDDYRNAVAKFLADEARNRAA